MPDFLKAVNRQFGAFLGAAVTEFAEVYDEFPEPNQEMSLPALSIVTGEPRFARCDAYVKTLGATQMDNTALNTYVVGQYDLSLQMDIWARYKVERNALYEKVFAALHPIAPIGVVIELTDYDSEKCNYQMVDYRLPDSMENSERQEWRATIKIEATCRALVQSTDFIITEEPVLDFSTPSTIE